MERRDHSPEAFALVQNRAPSGRSVFSEKQRAAVVEALTKIPDPRTAVTKVRSITRRNHI